MNHEQQDPDGCQYDALIAGERWLTPGKKGASTVWELAADVDSDEVRRLNRIAKTLRKAVGLLRHPADIPFAITRLEAGTKRYTFVLPPVGAKNRVA